MYDRLRCDHSDAWPIGEPYAGSSDPGARRRRAGREPRRIGSDENNGISFNGVSLNDISLNDISLKGISLKGISLKGISLKGISLNGIGLNGLANHEPHRSGSSLRLIASRGEPRRVIASRAARRSKRASRIMNRIVPGRFGSSRAEQHDARSGARESRTASSRVASGLASRAARRSKRASRHERGTRDHQPLGGSGSPAHAGSALPPVTHLGALNDAGPATQAAPLASEGFAIATSWPP
jgi:hypothetical protein